MKKSERTKQITPYMDIALESASLQNIKQLASAILLSAIEDADVEFLTEDFEEWKVYRKKRAKRDEVLNELDFKIEFNELKKYRENLFDICEVTVRASDIPQEILDERRLYESNKIPSLSKATGYKKETLLNMAKLHGWKIGVDYVEPSMFDDDF